MRFQFDLTKALENMEENVYVFSDPEKYDKATPNHPFYIEMVDEIKKEIRSLSKERPKILEIGCGPGTLTGYLLKLPFLGYVAIEPDKAETDYFKKKFAEQIKDGLTIHNQSFLEFKSDDKFDVIVASFVDHHIRPEEKESYYKKIMSLLAPGGLFISGEELICNYSNDDERIRGLFEYHGYIIKRCIEESHFDMAKIETRALKNGIERWDEFKISHSEYKKLLIDAGLKIRRFEKIGPEEIEEGGIYLIVSGND